MERKEAFRALVVLGTLVLALGRAAPAQYSGGAGTPEDPYQIATAQDLIDLGKTPDDYDKHFVLTADIDLSGYTFDQAVIAPGAYVRRRTMNRAFAGVFAGNGHTIRHLHIEGSAYLGLFGGLTDGAVVRDLGLEDASIAGDGYNVGGLVGYNDSGAVVGCFSVGTITGSGQRVGGLVGGNSYGHILNCYSDSIVTGHDGFVGGLVGENNSGGISNCHAAGAVTGNDYVGGLVGYNAQGHVANCYSIAAVTGQDLLGGLVGDHYSGSVVNSFWDTEASGITTGEGTGLTTAEMQDMQTYLHAGWDFVAETTNGTAEIWQRAPDNGYPRLSAFEGRDPVLPEGQGTMAEPFLIRNPQELGAMGYHPASSWRLESDIDLAGITWSTAPVPWFAGHFDGNGHTIHHLNIQGGGLLGLFGSLSAQAVVKHVDLEDGCVQGTARFVGALAGRSDATLASCYSTSTVSGIDDVGALIGHHSGSLRYCQTAGAVTGVGNVGGLVGCNDDAGRLSHCYSISAVTAEGDRVGGLVGRNDAGHVWDCYSTGAVTGRDDTGGLIGENRFGTVSNCYSVGPVTGRHDTGGLVGYNTGRVAGSFWDMDASGLASSAGGAGLTTAEMMDPEWVGLQGWADDPNWVLDPQRDYPRLTWEGATGAAIPEPTVDWMDGQGTSGAPYRIEDPHQLLLISKASILWDSNFVVMNDLNLAEIHWPQAVIPRLSGIFDGNGHTIAHLQITGHSDLGLVGHLEEDGEIANLRLCDVSIAGSSDRVGALVGRNRGGGLWQCHATGAVAGSYDVGGLVGNHSGGSLSIGSSTIAVMGDRRVGGLVGVNDGTVRYAYAAGTVDGSDGVGGLVGVNVDDGRLSDCYNTAAVAGTENVGGLVGTIYNGRVSNCYSTAVVTGETHIGGAVGRNHGDVVASFWDMETSRLTVSDQGMGLTTDAMQAIAIYRNAGWDLVGETDNGTLEIWRIDDEQDYPRLWWESIPED